MNCIHGNSIYGPCEICTPTIPEINPYARIRELENAAKELVTASKAVERMGARTGPQWLKLGIARMKMESCMNTPGGVTSVMQVS